MRSLRNHQGIPKWNSPRELKRLLPLMLVLMSMWVLSGCVITPIEAQQGGTPTGSSSATIAIAPVSGVPGDIVFVSGAGWESNESIYVNLEQTPDEEPIQTTVAIATTDDNGRFTITFAYPIDPVWREPGVIDVVAYSLETQAQASAPFEVLESPPPTAETVTPTPTTSATATSVPTAVPTGQPTATRTPTPQPGNVGTVVSSALNVRSGPSTAFPILRSIRRGTEFTVLGQNNSGAWLLVRLSDRTEGWLARAYTNFTRIVPVVPSPRPPAPTAVPTAAPTRPPQGSAWRGEYYNNINLSGDPVLVRNDADVNFDWGYGSPAPSINNDNFSARWVRSFFLPTGNYRFFATADDGVRVWVNGTQIINEWNLATGRTYSGDVRVDSGSALVRVEYYEATQIAKVRVWWELLDQQSFPDWRGEYFNNKTLTPPSAFVRNDYAIDFDWGTGSPASNFRSDNFSVRWTRDVYLDAGNYRFHAVMDDGMRVFLNDSLIIDEWRNGSAREVTRELYVDSGTHRLRVEFYEDTTYATARFWWERLSDQPSNFPDWRGEYWDNRHLDGDPRLVRNDRTIDFNWGNGSPDSRIPNDNFSARWRRTVDFDDARYRFYARADDGVRVWVGGNRIINEWRDQSFDTTFSAEIELDGREEIRVEYYERTGGARVHVWWEKVGSSPTSTPTRVEPYADVSPGQGPIGTTVRVTGGGFPANSTVNLYLGGIVQASSAQAPSAQVRASATTNGSGVYSMDFTIPDTWPDGSPVEPGRLVLLVANQDFSVEATANFEVTGASVPGGNPTANVAPSSGGEGTRVTVAGGGFPANTRVRAYLAGLVSASAMNNDMQHIASTTTDGSGNYSLSFNMPDEWPNGDDIETGKIVILIATDDFSVEASGTFNFFEDAPNPSIDIAPASGSAGTSVRVSGGGFPANNEVKLYLGSLDSQVGGDAGDRVYATTTTDRRGNYSMAFNMPSQWPDGSNIPTGRLVIEVANSDFSVIVGGSFNFTASGTPAPTPTPTVPSGGPTATPSPTPTSTPAPSANVNPTTGGAGTSVTVTGNGFPANTTVNAFLAEFGGGGGMAADAERYGTTTTDGNGNYSLTFVMPEHWPNGERIDDDRVLIVIATNDFSRQASATFAYNAASASGQTGEPTATDTVEPTAVPPTATALPTETVEPTATDVPTEVPTDTPEPTETPLPTNTPEPTAIPTEVPTNTPEPTETSLPTNTPEPTAIPTEVPTNTPEPTLDPTNTPEPTAVPTEVPTETPTQEAEPTVEQQQIEEPTVETPTEEASNVEAPPASETPEE